MAFGFLLRCNTLNNGNNASNLIDTTMSDYFTAYRARMERNDKYFRGLIPQFKELGCEVYAYESDILMSGITIVKDGKHCHFNFCEVPYRFELSACINPDKRHGSGYTIEKFFYTECDWTPEYIVSRMVENPTKNRLFLKFKKLM